MHGLCVMLCEVLTVGGSASLWVGRLVGGDACGIVCRMLARESGKWLGCRVLGACAALRRGGVGPPLLSTWTFFHVAIRIGIIVLDATAQEPSAGV